MMTDATKQLSKERVQKQLTKHYFALKLFLDDLTAIEEVLTKSGNDFSIEVGDYKYPSVNEVNNELAGQTCTNVTISSKVGYWRLMLYLTKSWAMLTSQTDDIHSTGVYHKLDTILSSRKRSPAIMYSPIVFLGAIALPWIALIVVLLKPDTEFPYGLQITSIVLYGVFMAWLVWLAFVRLRRNSIVVMEPRHSPHFLKRNKDQLIVAALIALISILGTAVLTANYPKLQAFLTSLLKLK